MAAGLTIWSFNKKHSIMTVSEKNTLTLVAASHWINVNFPAPSSSSSRRITSRWAKEIGMEPTELRRFHQSVFHDTLAENFTIMRALEIARRILKQTLLEYETSALTRFRDELPRIAQSLGLQVSIFLKRLATLLQELVWESQLSLKLSPA